MSNVRFAAVRDVIDHKFQTIHDELTAAYRTAGVWTRGAVAVDFGAVPDAKAVFDQYHALLWAWYMVVLDEENAKLPIAKRIDSSAYSTELTDANNVIARIKTDYGVEFPDPRDIILAVGAKL